MACPSKRRAAALLSLAGRIARHGRRQAGARSPVEAAPARGGWSSLIRLAPRAGESAARAPAWPPWKRPAPVFLCTDFALSQWFQP